MKIIQGVPFKIMSKWIFSCI